MTLTWEKLTALVALAGFLLVVSSHERAGFACMIAVAVITILRARS
jgi:hypothetical protein